MFCYLLTCFINILFLFLFHIIADVVIRFIAALLLQQRDRSTLISFYPVLSGLFILHRAKSV
jgi:hypothetical protein